MFLTSEINRSNIRISTLENHFGTNLQTCFQQFFNNFFDKYNNTNSPGKSPTTTYKAVFSNNYRSFQQKLLRISRWQFAHWKSLCRLHSRNVLQLNHRRAHLDALVRRPETLLKQGRRTIEAGDGADRSQHKRSRRSAGALEQ
jgi:hypothetical protein